MFGQRLGIAEIGKGTCTAELFDMVIESSNSFHVLLLGKKEVGTNQSGCEVLEEYIGTRVGNWLSVTGKI
jgi:hypothetical protein